MARKNGKTYLELANDLANSTDSDLIFYNGGISRDQDANLITMGMSRRRRTNVVLMLTTLGGNPDAAFRISRYLQATYEGFTVLVSGECKSAGTLIALGASEVAFGPLGELGPLDMQIGNKDEVFETRSGLAFQAALSSLQERAFMAFDHFLLESRKRAISTKLASEMAVKLACGVFSDIYAQIDPMQVGEAARSLRVASMYGDRLNRKHGNLKRDALVDLISLYPSHGFVIDYLEAQNLFQKVREATDAEKALISVWGAGALHQIDDEKPWMFFLADEPPAAAAVPDGAPDGDENEPTGGMDGNGSADSASKPGTNPAIEAITGTASALSN